MTQDTLQLYGVGFQHKLLLALIRSKTFLHQISDILNSEYFSSDGSKWIAQTVLEYNKQYKAAPTLEVFKVKVEDIGNEVLKNVVIDTLKEVYKLYDLEDLDFVQDQAIEFCKNQKLKSAILESVELLQQRKYDQIKHTIDAALKAGSDRNVGHEYVVDVADRYKENARNVVPTPWDVINEILDGGLGAGELGVFVAPAGIGKSMALVNIAAHAVQKGLKVIYYTLELSDTYVGARFDAHYTGIPSNDLKYHQQEVQDVIAKLPGSLIIKYYPNKRASVDTLEAHIEKCMMQGFKPDLVLIDYADRLKDVREWSKNMRNDLILGNIYDDLRGLAGQLQIPFYTASQASRSAVDQDIIEADKVAEAYSKVMIADFVVSLSRKVADKISGTGRWHVIKNRFGPDGLTFPSKMNMATAKIQIFAEASVQGKEVKGMMQKESEVTRQHLASKFAELQRLV